VKSRAIARLIVRCSAWLAPAGHRARWREEWLAEIASNVNLRSRFPRKRHPRSFSRALGAPRDALALRRLAWRERQRFHLGQWHNDLRYTLRLLLRSPGYVSTVVIGLSVGLTATITMYSLINTGLHGDIPDIVDRDALVRVRPGSSISLDTFPLFQEHGPGIVAVGAQGLFKTSVRVGDASMSIRGAFASGSLFDMLGTQPAAGRLLRPEDDGPAADAVVLGYRFWQVQFGGRAGALGQVLVIDNRPMRIVGVAPARFRGLWSGPLVETHTIFTTPDVWIPLGVARVWRGASGPDNPLGSSIEVAARLAPGVMREQAAAEFGAAARGLEARNPAEGPVIIRIRALALGAILDDAFWLAAAYAALLGMPLALLTIGCANVTNLRLARATARTQELAIRLSLGATRRQLARLLLIESTMLTMLALLVSALATRGLLVLVGPRILTLPIQIDWRVAIFAIAITTAATFISGLTPGWLVTRRATADAMRQTAQAGGVAHSRFRHTLVVVQIAVSLGLLAFGSLLLRATLAVHSTQPAGFDRLLVADLDFQAVGYDVPKARDFGAALLERLSVDRRFGPAGLAQFEPFRQPHVGVKTISATPISLAGAFNRVTSGWFSAAGLSPIAGRLLRDHDQGVAVLNATAARLLAPEGSAIGLRLDLRHSDDERQTVEVVGVVPDLERDLRRPRVAPAFVYLSLSDATAAQLNRVLYVREAAATDLSRDLRQMISTIEPQAPWLDIQHGADLFDAGTTDVRQMATAVTSMAIVALTVAAAGLFAVMAYTVALRTREIGIRMALGARQEDITRLVLRQGVRLAFTGAIFGLVLAQLIVQLLRPAILGISSFDPLALIPVAVLLIVVALTAGALPARRAATVDPVKALRAD
jgi:predicted permease